MCKQEGPVDSEIRTPLVVELAAVKLGNAPTVWVGEAVVLIGRRLPKQSV